MDRTKPELLVRAPDYIQHNLTIGEFLDKIEPAIGGDAARRLRALLDGWLSWTMPDTANDSPIPSPEDLDNDDD